MPVAVDICVKSLLKKWKDDPESRPKPKKEGQTAKERAWAICSAQSLESLSTCEFVFDAEMVLEDVDGKPQVRVPMLREGKFKHPWYGKLNFDADFFKSVMENYSARVVGYDLSLNARHERDLGALAWFHSLEKKGKQLYGIGEPTPAGIEVIKNKTYRYASAEISMDFADPETGKNHGPTLLGCAVTNNPFINRQGEITFFSNDSPESPYIFGGIQEMSEDTNQESVNDEVVALQQKLDTALAEATELRVSQTRVTELEAVIEVRDAEVVRLNESLYDQKVRAVLETAGAKSVDGKAHSPAVLNWAENLLKFTKFGSGDDIIKFEDGKHREYLLAAVEALFSVLTPVVPVEGQTGGENDRPGQGGADEHEQQEYEAGSEIWKDRQSNELFNEEE
jgi:hypothetical protein